MNVLSAMGNVVVRVPPTWTVDSGAVSALAGSATNADAADRGGTGANPALRLELRGLVMFGRLTIPS